MRETIIGVIMLLVFSTTAVVSCRHLTSKVDDYVDRYEAQVGKSIVFKGDTLIITDYSVLEKTFTLDDGREVSFELVKSRGHEK